MIGQNNGFILLHGINKKNCVNTLPYPTFQNCKLLLTTIIA